MVLFTPLRPQVSLRYRYAKALLSLLTPKERKEWENALDPSHYENVLAIIPKI